ncbi:MAG: SusC/RagA family TonB-linked outer membrane protein [Bacteroidales bacterium]
MKKIQFSLPGNKCFYLTKLLLFMKLTTFLLVINLVSFAATGYSQAEKVTIQLKNGSLKDLFSTVEQQTSYKFLYRDDAVENIQVNLDEVDEPLDNILNQILDGSRFTYKILANNLIVIAPRELLQQQKITGTVTDETGSPLPGVNVQIEGTTIGTISDASGKYSIDKPNDNAVLIFSFIGYTTQTVSSTGKTIIDITLAPSLASLDEVVVIGYGTVKRKDVTGSVASITEKNIANRPVARLDQALMGLIPGLDVVSTGATPGSATTILLRGKRSFQASNDPLFILDGMPFYGDLNDISPSDIKSVDVLKDASSTAIYGSRGANGVIIITTKRGQVSKPTFTWDSYAGPELKFGRIPLADAQEYATWAREAYRTMGGYPDIPGVDPTWDAKIFDAVELATIQSGGKGPDYLEELTDNGFQQRHQLSVNGGSEAVKYNFSGNYFKQEGLMSDDIFDRITLSTNIDVNISQRITSGVSIQVGRTANTRISSRGAYDRAVAATPLGQLRDENGEPVFQLMFDSLEVNPMADYWWNSYRYSNKNWSAILNSYVDIKILPFLTYKITAGTTSRFNKIQESAGYYSLNRNKGLPTAGLDENNSNFTLYESILSFNKTFNDIHSLTITAVHGIQTSSREASQVNVMDIPYEDSRYYNIGTANTITGVGSGLEEWNLLSYVGRINYGYKSKYLLSVSFRADGASQFAPGHKWGYFPSASVAYRIVEENFMTSTRGWLSDLKLRASYGVTGNQAIQPYQVQGALSRTTYAWGTANGFGYRPITLANKKLKWESTAVTNLGLDFGFFQGRISGNIDLYNTNTYDLLMYRKLPIHTGYDQVLENVGKTNNKGLEIAIRSINIDRNSFTWSTDLSFYTNKTQIVELYQGKKDDIGNLWFIGQPLNVYYDYEKIGIWQLDEATKAASYGVKPGQIKLKDQNNDGKYNDLDRVILGNNEPDFIANIVNNFTFKNWDFGFTTYVRWGGMTYVGLFEPFAKKRYNKIIFDYWTPENPTNDYPRPNQLYEGSGLYGSTLSYRDASYIQVSQLSLGYTLPQSLVNKIKVSKTRVYLQAYNPFYWTKSELSKFNMKPDWSGTNVSTYHATRTIVLGINLNF